VALWVARGDIVARGYSLKSSRLWPPSAGGVRAEPAPDEWNEIASLCQRLQGEMLEWANVSPVGWDPRAVYDGTFDSLCRIYLEDPDSPFHNCRFQVRRSYESVLNGIRAAVGKARVQELTFRDFKRWHEKFCEPEKVGQPERRARGHGRMTMIRIVMSFGSLLRLPGCRDAKDTLSAMEFATPKRREEILTAAQATTIRAMAHKLGYPSIALAQAIMYELGLRQKDVIGEWIPIAEPGISMVTDHGDKWVLGLVWEQINGTLLEHRLSKSLKGRKSISDPDAGKIMQYDLSLYPMILEELALFAGKRSGPMVIAEHSSQPWRQKVFASRWRKIARAAGIPDHVQNRDTRAGAASESDNAGAGEDRTRQALGHSRVTTTRGYIRNQAAATAEVAVLRVKNRPQTT
jgi:integrase